MTRILGIDPGSQITGYGIIDSDGNHSVHITHGNIRIEDDDLPEKLRTVFENISGVIEKFNPEENPMERYHSNFIFLMCYPGKKSW